MRKIEIILVVLSIVLFLLSSIFDFKFINPIIIIILLITCMFYTYLGFAVINNIALKSIFNGAVYKKISTYRILGAILTGISIGVFLIGIMFKSLSWPGANINLYPGIAGIIISFLFSIFYLIETKDKFYKINIIRTLIFILLFAFSFV